MKLIKLATLILVASYSVAIAICLLAIYVGLRSYVQLLKAQAREEATLDRRIAEIDCNIAGIEAEIKDEHFRYFMEVESL